MATLIKGYIGDADLFMEESNAYPSGTFSRQGQLGTVNLKKLPNLYKTHQSITNAQFYNSGALTAATLNAAIAAIGTSTKTVLYIGPGDWTINANVSFANYANITPMISAGANLVISSGSSITFNTQPEIPLSPVFSGAGLATGVSGLGVARPEWFGALADGSTNDRAAIQAAHNSTSYGTILFSAKTYVMGKTLVGSYNRCISVTSNHRFVGQGMGNTILKCMNSAGDYYSMFCHDTPGTQVLDLAFYDMTINQNTSNNALVTDPPGGDSARNIISVGGTSSGLRIERVRFDECSGVSTVIPASHATIKGCEFLNVGNDTFVHDHSTIYTNGSDNVIEDNIFHGYAVNAKGAYTAIETHGSRTAVKYNRIVNYWGGMNITGVSAASDEEIDVSHNVISNAKCGIKIWSQTTYTIVHTGYGIDGLKVKDNQIFINQNEWGEAADSDWNEEASGIRFYGPSANLPVRGADISYNLISYVASTEDIDHSTTNGGICWMASNVNTEWATGQSYAAGVLRYQGSANYVCKLAHTSGVFADDLAAGLWHTWLPGLEKSKIENNTIINCPINAVQIQVRLTNVSIKNNNIYNAGSTAAADLPLAAYRAGIFIAPSDDLYTITGLEISGNMIQDDYAVPRMTYGIYMNNTIAATVTGIKIGYNPIIVTGNTSDGGNQFVQSLYIGTSIAPMYHGAEFLLSKTTVAFDANADTTLYTVPAGYRCTLTKAIIVAAGNANSTDITIGQQGATNDWLPTNQMDNLDAANDAVVVRPMPDTATLAVPAKIKSYAAGTVIQISVANQAGAAGNTVYLFGVLY